MKNFSFALLFASVFSLSFVVSPKAHREVIIKFDESKTGHDVFFNYCTSEYVDLTFRYVQSVRGTMNDKQFTFRVQYNERQEGVGQTTKQRYSGHVTNSYNEKGSVVNSKIDFSQIVRIKMVTPGGGNNYKSISVVKYSLDESGEVTSSREFAGSECN